METDPIKFHCSNFLQNIRTNYQKLATNDKYSDVTLVSEDKTVFKCHKVILSSVSTVLDKLFNVMEDHLPLAIYMRGISDSDLNSVLQLIYTGETSVSTACLPQFLQVATELKLLTDDKLDESGRDEEELFEVNISEPKQVLIDEYGSDVVNIQMESENHDIDEISKKEKAYNNLYFCDKCDFKSVHKQNVKQHVHNLHTGLPIFCEQCDFSTIRKDVLANHIQCKHEGLKILCDLCDYKTTNRSNLNHHIKVKHEGITSPCNECSYEATSNTSLKGHKERVHEKKTYQCNYCEMKVTDRGYLKKHTESMHEGKKFSCDHCNHTTSFRSSLLKHVQSKHKLLV